MDISGVISSLDQVQYLKKDIQSQLANLVDENFLIDVSLDRIKQFPRYLKAITARLSKFPHLGKNDLKYTSELNNYWGRYKALAEEEGLKNHKDLQGIRWMIEEYRVSLFAQSLGTNMSVSPKRIERQFALIIS
jgi:ATP-dependent helicase HrpA